MKYFMLTSLFILTLFNNIKAQSPLTIREAFNFAVGDTFVYRDSLYQKSYATLNRTNFVGITITKKWVIVDTIFYQRKISTMTKEAYQSWNGLGISGAFYPHSPWDFTDTTILKTDTLAITDLDSIVTYKIADCTYSGFKGWGFCSKGDSTFIIPNDFNQRLITQGFVGVGNIPSHQIVGEVYSSNAFYFQRCGYGLGTIIKIDYDYIFGQLYYSIRELLQYRKGNETWQKQLANNTTVQPLNIQLSPNPTNGFLSIKSNESFDHIRVVGISGFVFFEKQNTLTKEETVQLTNLPNGFYFVQTFKKGRLMSVGKCLVNH